jgi:hypothetical protein
MELNKEEYDNFVHPFTKMINEGGIVSSASEMEEKKLNNNLCFSTLQKFVWKFYAFSIQYFFLAFNSSLELHGYFSSKMISKSFPSRILYESQ